MFDFADLIAITISDGSTVVIALSSIAAIQQISANRTIIYLNGKDASGNQLFYVTDTYIGDVSKLKNHSKETLMVQEKLKTGALVRDLTKQYRYFLLTIIFSALAVAIQTSSFGKNNTFDFAELVSYILLISSGVFGLKKLYEEPKDVHTAHSNIELLESFANTPYYNDVKKKINVTVDKRSKQVLRTINLHHRLLIIGAILLGVSRLGAKLYQIDALKNIIHSINM